MHFPATQNGACSNTLNYEGLFSLWAQSFLFIALFYCLNMRNSKFQEICTLSSYRRRSMYIWNMIGPYALFKQNIAAKNGVYFIGTRFLIFCCKFKLQILMKNVYIMSNESLHNVNIHLHLLIDTYFAELQLTSIIKQWYPAFRQVWPWPSLSLPVAIKQKICLSVPKVRSHLSQTIFIVKRKKKILKCQVMTL